MADVTISKDAKTGSMVITPNPVTAEPYSQVNFTNNFDHDVLVQFTDPRITDHGSLSLAANGGSDSIITKEDPQTTLPLEYSITSGFTMLPRDEKASMIIRPV